MKFGLVMDFSSPTRTLAQQLERYSEVIAAADKYGFDSITMGEGSGPKPAYGHTPAPFLVLAALAPNTRMRLGSGVTLLPTWHPLKLAYETAMLDQITGGRFILGIGMGPPDLPRRYGLQTDNIGAYADEVLDALKALWSGANGYEGKYVNIEGGIGLTAVHPGGPPIWVGGSVQRSANRAAKFGDGYVGSTSQSFDDVVRMGQRLRTALTALGKDSSNATVASNRLTIVAETEAEARQSAEQYAGEVLSFYANRGAQMPPELVRAEKTPAELFNQLNESRCLVGTPDQVTATARRYADAGVTDILCRICPHDIPVEHVLRTVTLMGEHVLPKFR